jgi:hypothetical protein
MTNSRGAPGRSIVDKFRQTTAEIDEGRRALEAAGSEAWNRSTRAGGNVLARTTQELRALGARVLPQVAAGTNGAVDAATAGLGDKYTAFKLASEGIGAGRTLPQRYKSIRQLQDEQDQYDREHYSKARLVGGAVGTVGSIALTGGAGAAEQGAVRLAPYAARAVGYGLRPVVAHVLPHVAVGGAGAAASVTGQLASDVASGRLSNLPTYGEAAAGGAVGGLTTSYVGPRAGAVAEAATAEGFHGLRTGDFSLERLENGAVLGSHFARAGDLAGRNWAESLPIRKKGKLGEKMSDVKSRVSGQSSTNHGDKVDLSKGHTFIDSRTNADITVESKFGPWARLSKSQLRAQAELNNYAVDHWLSEDIGKVTGGLSGLLFGQSLDHRRP